MPPEQQTDRSDASLRPGLGQQVRTDLTMLHTGWMDLAFPRQREPHPVLGKWEPSTAPGRAGYWLWSAVGLPVVAVGYVFVLAGVVVRFYSRRLSRAALGLGALGALLLTAAVWSALTVGAYLLDFSAAGVVAVAVGGGVAAVSAALATAFTRRGGRPTTVLLAFPFGVTAVFLPPVVAALFSPTLAAWVFPNSYTLAVWLLENPLSVWGLAAFLRAQFELVGVAYVGMWFGLAVPVGWALGLFVTLADAVRPATEDADA